MWKISIDIRNKAGIYYIENIINGKMYIGSSKNIFQRLNKHRAYLRKGIHDNKRLQKDWNIFGEDNFVYGIFEYCKPDELLEEEEQYVNSKPSAYNIEKSIVARKRNKQSNLQQSHTRKKKFITGELTASRKRNVYQYNLDGSFVKEYESIHQAARICNINISSIERVLNGTYSQSNGYQWSYEFHNCIGVAKARKSKLWRPVIVYDLVDNTESRYDSVNECARALPFSLAYVSLAVRKGLIMGKRYMIKYDTAVHASN